MFLLQNVSDISVNREDRRWCDRASDPAGHVAKPAPLIIPPTYMILRQISGIM